MPNIIYNKKEDSFLVCNRESIFIFTYFDNYNGNGGGDNDMEKRLLKLETGIDFIKDKLSSHDDEFKKIDNRFDKIDARLDKTENIYTNLESSVKVINTKLDNLKENCISYKGLFGMFAVFTTIIGFFIKYFH